MDKLIDFLNYNGIPFAENKKASGFTTFRIGGDCFAVYPGSENELTETVGFCVENGIRYVIIGCGSNVLFSDEGFDGAVIMTQSLNGVRTEGDLIYAGAGAPLHTVCRAAYESGLSGAEFAYGIPGSVGGAVFMNAGAYGGEMKDIVKSVTVYVPETGEVVSYAADQCGFSYRHSVFEDNGAVILSAVIELVRADKYEIKAKMDDLINRRREKQPLNYPSAGSTFKRYPGRFTGQMIEAAGLKGYCVGGAAVSEKHAGFVINKGGATCGDVLALIDHIKSVIREREGVDIECEVRIIK